MRTLGRSAAAASALFLALGLASCGTPATTDASHGDGSPSDGSSDAASDVLSDTTADGTVDAPTDAGVDAASDAVADRTGDTGPTDSGTDVTDGGVDSGGGVCAPGCEAYPTGTYAADGSVGVRPFAGTVPSGAYYVAPTGSNSNPGTATSPWATIQYAANTAPSGSTVVVHGGVYREAVVLGRTLTIESAPGENVWLEGAQVVTGWTAVADGGNVWVHNNWTVQFQFTDPCTSSPCTNDQKTVDPTYPMAGHPDMVFIDGQPLRQVGSLGAVTSGTFYVDYGGNHLYVGSDPTGATVEASVLQVALKLTSTAAGSTIRGIGARHYATDFASSDTPFERGTFLISAANATIESCTSAWNAAAGFEIANATGVTLRLNTLAFNGFQGFSSVNTDNMVVEHNAIVWNDQEHFNRNEDGGGFKISSSMGTIARDNFADGNLGTALWWDVGCNTGTAVRNIVMHTNWNGIKYEISSNAFIESNLVIGNVLAGIDAASSTNLRIVNNTSIANGADLRYLDDSRPQVLSNVYVRNNIFMDSAMPTASGSDIVHSLDSMTGLSATDWMIDEDYSAFYRSGGNPSTLVLWATTATTTTPYRTLGAFRSATGEEMHGFEAMPMSPDPFFVDAARGDYRVRAGSQASGAGMTLGSGDAMKIGVTPGVAVDMGALLGPQCSCGG